MYLKNSVAYLLHIFLVQKIVNKRVTPPPPISIQKNNSFCWPLNWYARIFTCTCSTRFVWCVRLYVYRNSVIIFATGGSSSLAAGGNSPKKISRYSSWKIVNVSSRYSCWKVDNLTWKLIAEQKTCTYVKSCSNVFPRTKDVHQLLPRKIGVEGNWNKNMFFTFKYCWPH